MSCCTYQGESRTDVGYFAGVIRNGALCHDLRMRSAAPDHRRDRYTAVIVLVQEHTKRGRSSNGLTRDYVAVTLEAMRYNREAEPALNIELSINERHALKSAAVRLQAEFANAFDMVTVERLVHSSYETLAAHATVHD